MTLAQLRAAIRLTLANGAGWPDATLDGWIAAAVRLYSAHFPRRERLTLDLVTGVQSYDLPVEGLVAVLSVEQPVGVIRQGWDGYRIVAPGRIVFAGPVCTGEQAVVEVLAGHPIPAADDALLTVAPQHIEALTAYVEFAAHYQLECAAAPVVDSSTIVLAQLGDEARRAWVRYKEVLDRLTWLGGPALFDSPYVTWGDVGL